MNHQLDFLKLVADAQTRIQEMTVSQFLQKLENQDSFHLIDVREDREWLQGHLPKAIHLSKGVIERDIVNAVPDKCSTIVLYCGGGYRSALAADAIQKMGYLDIWSLQGGFKAWLQAGLPVE